MLWPQSPSPGKSLIPAFQEDVVVKRDCLWWLHEGNRAVRVDDWKLVAAKGEPWELYDLRTDRAEQNNLALEMPEKVIELEAIWQAQTDVFSSLAAQSLDLPAQQKSRQKKPLGESER